ncbi:MAG: hypothetical protein HFI73_03380 [Bacilli bacterium]|jgi:hypothetical protein|nr:hypothetical protein [Bacilli bacterium]
MFSNEKIKQVFNAIKDNGIEAFDDESLAKLLSILSEEEFDLFEARCYQELDGIEALKRIMGIRSFAEAMVVRELYRIRTNSLYDSYKNSLVDGTYRELFKSLKVEELADLKKYVSFTIDTSDEENISGSKKIINMITREIKTKEELRKPRFE